MSALLHEVVAQALTADPNEAAIEFNGGIVNWGYLQKVVARLDAVLTEAGLGPSSPIGLIPRNRPSFAAAMLSLLAARRSIIMAYAFQSPTAIAKDIAKMSLPAVIADAQDWNAETLGALAPNAIGISLSADLNDPDPVRLIAGDLKAKRDGLRGLTDQPVVELLTSGTTGAPKRSPTLYATLEHAIIKGSVLDAGKDPGARGEPGTVNFPLSNISGIYSYLPMAVAHRLVLLMEKFDIDIWADFIKRHKPKAVIAPPAGIRMLIDNKLARDHFAGVQCFLVGTTPLDRTTHAAFEAYYGVPILLSYGSTEFAGAATAMTADLHAKYGREKFGSVGRASGTNEVRVIDPVTKKVLAPNNVGIIEVKIPMLGDNFITTTDLGLMDEDDFVFIHGRVDGVIMRGGFKIMPNAIEGVLNTFPGVAACCVVGVPDRRLGQVPVAAIEMVRGAKTPEASAFEAHLRESLPATNIPVEFRIVPALPRTPSMKIDLKGVRDIFADTVSTSSNILAGT